MARGLIFGMRLYLHPCLCVQAVKALVRLTACATASKNWILIEYIIIMKISRARTLLQSIHVFLKQQGRFLISDQNTG